MQTLFVAGTDQLKSEDMHLALPSLLRTALMAYDYVILPASINVLPLAAVIVRGLKPVTQIMEDGVEHKILPKFPARIIPHTHKDMDYLKPFLSVYLGGMDQNLMSKLDLTPEHEDSSLKPKRIDSLEDSLGKYPPDHILLLTHDDSALTTLQQREITSHIIYFKKNMIEDTDIFQGRERTALDAAWRDRDIERDRERVGDREAPIDIFPYSLLFQKFLYERDEKGETHVWR